MNSPAESSSGVVVIGRNEGERLRRCLASVIGEGRIVVYVDSASLDGSTALARSMGAEVVDLDMSIPFSAARARNAGVERLKAIDPSVAFVQFVDGDCEMVKGWLERAGRAFAEQPDLSVVAGRLRERFPEHSVYNRLADLEWDTPVGPVKSCGGIAMMRLSAFDAVGGFDPSVVAGEEPELCQRLREAGGAVLRLPEEMALHDSAMTRFSQWWTRSVRGGYGALDVAQRFARGKDGLFVRQIKSARLWGIGWPFAVAVAGLALGIIAGWKGGIVATAIVAFAAPAQVLRLALRIRRRVSRPGDALAFGTFTLLSKWANLLGQYRFLRDRAAGKRRLIEYKAPAPKGPTTSLPQSAAPVHMRLARPADNSDDRWHGLRPQTGDGHAAVTGVSRMSDPDWQADLRRYPPRPFLREQSVWALAVYRFGRRNDRRKAGLRRKLGGRVYWLAYRIVETLTGISIPKSVEIGPGLRIHHFGNIFIHAQAKIGAHCTLRQGVTIGNRHEDGPVPVIEDDVEMGAYAQILGGMRIGRGARIGAMSLVLNDVPPGATAVGVPAKIMQTTDQLEMRCG